MKAKKRPESVLVVIYDRNGDVLVLQRQDDPSFWQSVTGSMEANETPFDTAVREVLEETGIDIKALELSLVDHQTKSQYTIRECWRYKFEAGVTVNTEHLFSLEVPVGIAISLTEHLQFEWLDKRTASMRMWSDSNKQGVLDCVAGSSAETAERIVQSSIHDHVTKRAD